LALITLVAVGQEVEVLHKHLVVLVVAEMAQQIPQPEPLVLQTQEVAAAAEVLLATVVQAAPVLLSSDYIHKVNDE
jgi:hypothetical protein